MTKDTVKKIHFIYGIVLSLLVTAVAVLFVVMCVDIYKSAPTSPFTRQSIAEHFMPISALVYACIGFIIGGALLNIICPLEPKKERGAVKDSVVLHKLLGKVKTLDSESMVYVERRHTTRLVLTLISFVLLLGASIASFVSALMIEPVLADMNSQIIAYSLLALRFYILPFAFVITVIYICKRSVKKDLELVKKEFAQRSQDAVDVNEGTFIKITQELTTWANEAAKPKKWHGVLSTVVKCVVAAVAITFIIIGINNGGMADVLGKAMKICTECIGMG
jgi:hypothetical protein